MCQRPYSTTVSSRSSRGVQGLCIAVQNSDTLGKSLQQRSAGRPSVSEEVHTVAALVDIDRSQTIRELAHETGLAHTTVLRILKECLGMRKSASRWVPHDLTEMQKWMRYDAA
ncbi:hypothetical protein J437_LFUL004206 [Ladona fulva]|uniref:Transposase n=1 Tax=Ladona fulva TaxID=123851 RepID=A0A8K0JXI2_LADFU|nr:hypothetical protein J437_LFUL004206 [Ladona fulva]